MRIKERILALLLLLTVLVYLGGSTLFIHSHTVNGTSVVHSHPFSGSASSHSHSASSIDTISRLATPEMHAEVGMSLEGIVAVEVIDVAACICVQAYSAEGSIHSLRAPPVGA